MMRGFIAASLDGYIADKSGRLLEQIVPNIQNTAKLVQEIAAASQEQTSGADQVNNAIQEFNKVIQQNAAGAEEIASSSEELASQAEHLKETISFFKIDKHQRSSTSKINKSTLRPAIKTHAPVKSSNGRGVAVDLGKAEGKDTDYEKY